MRPHPKIRKPIKWGGAAASVLLAVVWVGSGWWMTSWWPLIGFRVSVVAGALNVDSLSGDLVSDPWLLYFGPHDFPIVWTPSATFHNRHDWFAWIPLWIPAGVSIVPAVAAWWLDRRARRGSLHGACTKCGYDRAGIAAETVCPECGAESQKQD